MKKKINEVNFSEPKSLIGNGNLSASSVKKSILKMNAFDYSNKKVPDTKTSKFEAGGFYDLKLETVQEKVNDLASVTIDKSGEMSKK